jgi:hypothetical protein
MTRIVHADDYKTTKCYTRFTSASSADHGISRECVGCTRKHMLSGLDPCAQTFTVQSTRHTFYFTIVYCQESMGIAECQHLPISHSPWIVNNIPRSNLMSFFPNTLIINIDTFFRVEVNNEMHLDSKMAYLHGMQHTTTVQS